MKKFALIFSFILYTLYSLFSTHTPLAHAISVEPFPPFSIEGNPPEDYHFGEFFPLFRYIRPASLEIYENEDRSRNYEDVAVCPGGDRRDYECSIDASTGAIVDSCDGGEVDVCYRTAESIGGIAFTANSTSGSCQVFKSPSVTSGVIQGTCKYVQRPSIRRDVKGADFSKNESLVYPKIQSGSLAYINRGTDNSITWGTTYLSLTQRDLILRQLMVLRRARETKATVAETGEWPLGWVDWGYQDEHMSKNLLDIYDSLPSGVASSITGIVEAEDRFLVNGAELDLLIDKSTAKAYVVSETVKELSKPSPAEWALDVTTVPPYPPSFRQSFFRPSICVWDICCPGFRCKVEPIGAKRGLSYDTSISQAFGGAVENLFLTLPLQQAIRAYKDIAAVNPLIRFAGSAAVGATPSRIHEKLSNELGSTECYKYVPWGNFLGFGYHIDYLNPGSFLGPNETCPDYQIYPELKKETAAAFVSSPLSALLNFLWGKTEDSVDRVKHHLITIPEAMGQSIQELQQPFYDSRDTLAELDKTREYNEGMSNSIDDNASFLLGGQSSIPSDSKRRLAYYSCDDTMFSSQMDTSIQAYALGTRIGCFDTTSVPEGICNGQLFASLIEGSKYSEVSAKGDAYFNTYIKGNLTPELMNTYAQGEIETGVPCEILAGIHFVEAGNNPEGSLVSGRKLGTPEPDAGGKVFRSLLETAKYAGDHLKGKVGGSIGDAETAITALSRYNGGGNSNCQKGYPHPIPYGGCPRLFEGEDDPYPTSFLDNKHDNMYLLYCADRTACVPQVFERPGSFTVALAVYNSITKSGYSNTDLPPAQENPVPAPSVKPDGSSTSSGFFPESCGPESLNTALGCIPYTRDAFASALLSFVVGMAGAIALVIMLIATGQIMTARDNAEKLQKAKELFTAAILGLLFLIFSVSLLRLIAGDIIKLPGF